MKFFKVFWVALFLMVLLASFKVPVHKHVGTWEGIDDKGNKGLLILKEDSAFLFTLIITTTLNNNVVEEKHRKVSGKYVIDYDNDPVSLELIWESVSPEKEASGVKGSIRFITDHQMELRISVADECCNEFDPEFQMPSVLLNKILQADDCANR